MKKKLSKLITISAGLFIITSCATTKVSESSDTTTIEVTENKQTEKVRKEPKQISVQNTSNQQEKQFKEMVSKLELKITSKPKTVYANKDFNAPYIVNITDENGPVANLNVTVSYPSARTNDSITYNNIQLTSDEAGNVTFKPETPAFAVKGEVTFYPTPVSSNSVVVQAAYDTSVKAPYNVKSSYVTYPFGILYVYDFNENGRPTTNNFTLLQCLRNSGVSVGNSPISDTSFFNKSVADLYKANYNIVGNAYNFLVIGKFKYAEPAVEAEGSSTVKLTAEITCVDMKNGNVLYETSFEQSATDKNKWSAEQKARKALAEKASEAIIYGM